MTDPTPPSELDEVIVIGKRAKRNTEIPPEEMEEVPEDGDSGGTSGGMTQAEVDAENERQKKCAAAEFKTQMQDIPTKNSKESFSYVLNRDGNTVITPPVAATGSVITPAERGAVITAYSIQPSEILGFVHNHPRNVYCDSDDLTVRSAQIALNAYPSANDLDSAESFLDLNPSIDPSTFSLFVLGCDNIMREFPFSQMALWRQKVAQPNPVKPPEMEADC
ncbi:MAG: hypothetical protein RL093_86 [Pseudomonadota bacterium]|jgi:hypothetical protein